MKQRRFRMGLSALIAALLLFVGGCREDGNMTRKLADLGIPLLSQYTDESTAAVRARCAWDMVAYEGNVYIGCGDYDTKMGPVYVWSYHPDEKAWRSSAESLPDEQIRRYALVDGTLCILGTDPKGDWDMGSYYLLSEGEWQEHRVLPSGIHCFDAVAFDGKLFFGLGVNSGDLPVVMTEDGETFEAVSFVRDGEEIDTSASFVRVYNLMVYDGVLYAFLTIGEADAIAYDVYRFNGAEFCYLATPPAVFIRSYDIAYTGEFAGLATLINGYCYFVSEDMESFRPWRVGDSDLACDAMVVGDTLYVLAYIALEDGTYQSAVYSTSDGREFTKLFYFVEEIPANRFAYADGVFYFSMGRYSDVSSYDVGRVYALKYTIE